MHPRVRHRGRGAGWWQRFRYSPEAAFVHHYRGTRNMITFTWEQTPYNRPAKETVGEVRVVDTVSRFYSPFANQIGASRIDRLSARRCITAALESTRLKSAYRAIEHGILALSSSARAANLITRLALHIMLIRSSITGVRTCVRACVHMCAHACE